MRRLAISGFLALALAVCAAGAVLAAPPLGTVYGNTFKDRADLLEMRKTEGRHCTKSLGQGSLDVFVGRRTPECSLRTPVVGRDLEIAASVTLSRETPGRIRKRTFVSVSVRSGVGGEYELAVYPARREFKLFRDAPDGQRIVLGTAQHDFIQGIGSANKLRLRMIGGTLVARVNGQIVDRELDADFRLIQGRNSTVAVGSATNARRAKASFDSVLVRIPIA
jgi:hypothetical protein